MRPTHPFIAELKRYVANQNSILSSVVLSISDILGSINVIPAKQKEEIYKKQLKLSEVTGMIHGAYNFHRSIQDGDNHTPADKRDNIMSLLIGDYLLAQSSVDLADIRYPETVGLIAQGLEDYTRGEFMRLNCKEKLNFDAYAELTCGSLLANACQSATIIAGCSSRFGHLVYEFGLNTGSASRLIECKIEKQDMIKCRLNKAIDLLLKLPDVEERTKLLSKLKSMMPVCNKQI